MATRPSKEHTPQYRDEAARGNAAKLIMENPVFRDITRDMRETLIKAWLSTAPDDVTSREWFHQQALAQHAIINAINKTIQTGVMADMSLRSLAALEPTPTSRRRRNG